MCAELEGILLWCLEGLHRLVQNNFRSTAVSYTHLDVYKRQSAVYAPQAATHIDDTVFHGLFLHRFIPFPSQYNGTAGNTH